MKTDYYVVFSVDVLVHNVLGEAFLMKLKNDYMIENSLNKVTNMSDFRMHDFCVLKTDANRVKRELIGLKALGLINGWQIFD